MPKEVNPKDPTKWTRTYESEECISTWKYDYSIFRNGPVSVEHKWKKGFELGPTKKKTLGDLVGESKKTSKSKKTKS
jgi:hypothetical protein